jgi:hypothetical protein
LLKNQELWFWERHTYDLIKTASSCFHFMGQNDQPYMFP